MSNDAVQVLTLFPKIIWQLFTGFKIPGLNFTPAVFFFGVLSFSLAYRTLRSIITLSSSGFAMDSFNAVKKHKSLKPDGTLSYRR